MYSKTNSRLLTIFLCIYSLLVLFQCISCQPVETDVLETKNNNNDGISLWNRPLTYSDSDELNNEDIASDELLQLLANHLISNQAKPSSIVRRANFWKRANFWRKRANFWRRDLSE